MMKSFLVLLVLTATATFSASASASTCTVDLKNGRGKLLQVFSKNGYNRNDACRSAKQDCRRVKRAGYYRAPVQVCIERQIRRPIQQRKQCTVAMKNRRGRTVEVFSAVSTNRQAVNACQKARFKCQKAKYRQGRREASCQVISRGPVGRDDRGQGRGRGRGGRRG